MLAGLAGLLLALVRHRRLSGELEIPFGPPLALAFWLLLLAAQQPQLFGVLGSSAIR
jgi:prepilin signal peptidase PulO-like enzyme (type II secretory pathway)